MSELNLSIKYFNQHLSYHKLDYQTVTEECYLVVYVEKVRTVEFMCCCYTVHLDSVRLAE